MAIGTGMRESTAVSQRRVRVAVLLRLRAPVLARAWVLFTRVKARRSTTRTRTGARSSTVSRVCVCSFSQPDFFFCSPVAIVAQQFLDATKSQLTYHGLFQLASTLQPDSLVALFRNAHLSVVYKSPGGDPGTPHPNSADPVSNPNLNSNPDDATQDAALYALVTDDAFLHEPSIVWERLEDVDGYSSSFVDSNFHRAVPIGGDVAGQTAEGALRRFEMEAGLCGVVNPAE